jgi:hypothetical protein
MELIRTCIGQSAESPSVTIVGIVAGFTTPTPEADIAVAAVVAPARAPAVCVAGDAPAVASAPPFG